MKGYLLRVFNKEAKNEMASVFLLFLATDDAVGSMHA
jgi:hypothetical protein